MEAYDKSCYTEHNSVLIKALLQYLWRISLLFVCLFHKKFSRDPVSHFPCGYCSCQISDICQNITLLPTYKIVLRIFLILSKCISLLGFSLYFSMDRSQTYVHMIKIKPSTYSVQDRHALYFFNSFWDLCMDFFSPFYAYQNTSLKRKSYHLSNIFWKFESET